MGASVAGVVVAAGRSVRFGGSVPKQFADLGGASVLARSAAALQADPRVAELVLVLPEEVLRTREGDAAARLPGVRSVVPGGETRAASVLAGVEAVSAEHVLVHDAARPLVSPALVAAVVEATLAHGAAVPVVPVRDTLKLAAADGWVERTVDRGPLRLAQTPQGARRDWLLDALLASARDGADPTDEAAALERAGRRVRLVEGDPGNVKITSLADLEEARARLGARAEWRVGNGFDVHRFAPGRRLVLGGVEFPGEAGLEGHSDADVVLHAAMDALLGAAGLGDIGAHFPPGAPEWAGADSRLLAGAVAALVRDAGWEPANLDLTVLAERPRLRPRVEEVRASIGAALGVDPARVSVKATTFEGLGALGRAEGIACQATALLWRTR